MRRILFTLFVVFPSLFSFSQEISGIWRGTFYNEFEYLLNGSKYRFEVQLKANGEAIKGVTYSYQTTRFYGKADMVGKWAPGTKDLTIVETRMVESKMSDGDVGCLMTCYLTYRKEGNNEYLEGTYTSVSASNVKAPCGGGMVRLERVMDSDFGEEDFLKEKSTPEKAGTKPGQSDYLIKKPTPTTTPAKKSPTPSTSSTAKKPAPTAKTSTAKTNTAQPAPQKAPTKTASTAKAPAPTSSSSSTAKTPAQKTPAPATAKTTAPKSTAPPVASNSKPVPAVPKSGTQTKPVTPAQSKAADPGKTDDLSKIATVKAPPQTAAVKTIPAQPAVIKNRQNEIVETISTAAKSIEISFYDNGEIDGDTISVFDNNRLVVYKKGLSAEAITIRLTLEDNEPEHQLVMVAENLGSIPPNTALMIVQAGAQRYTVRLTSNEQKNAAVNFKYDPDALK